MQQNLIRSLVALGVLAALFSFAPAAGAQDTPALTIHARVCPTSNVPDDFFATCHGSPGENIEFFDGSSSIGTSGADGNLVYDLGAAGSVDLNGGVPGEFARNFIYCSANADQSIVVDFTFVEAGTSVSVDVSDTGTTCDWYVVPEDLSGNTPTPAPVATSTPSGGVTQLPNTGVGESNGSNSMMLILLAILALGTASVGTFAMVRVRR